MNAKDLTEKWFEVWAAGDIENLPLTQNFKHTSPYGVIETKETYMKIVRQNKHLFLGNTYEIHDIIGLGNKACVRYTVHSPSHTLQVSEWIYSKNNLISEIVAYYNIQEDKAGGREFEIDR